MRTVPCDNWSATTSRSPESEFEAGCVPRNAILNYSLMRKGEGKKKLGKCPVWERGGDRRVRQRERDSRGREREGERGRGGEGVVADCRTNPHSSRLMELLEHGPKQLKLLHTGDNSLSSLCERESFGLRLGRIIFDDC